MQTDEKQLFLAKHRILSEGENRERALHTRYRLSLDGYEKLLVEQDFVCAICLQPDSTGQYLSVDHDHSCCPGKKSCGKCIRGLLCNSCNRLLGVARDNVKTLDRAIRYLKGER